MRAFRVPAAFYDWLTVPRSLALVAIAVGAMVLAVTRGGAYVALQVAPLSAMLVAAPVIALAGHYFGWVEERVWAPWQGIYHAFDDHQIRVVEMRDRLWFSSDDVHAALAMPKRTAVLHAMRSVECRRDETIGPVLSTDGLANLLGRSTDRRALRLLNWARHDVERPWTKKRLLAVSPSNGAASAPSTSPTSRDVAT
jgi:hypothetical protein